MALDAGQLNGHKKNPGKNRGFSCDLNQGDETVSDVRQNDPLRLNRSGGSKSFPALYAKSTRTNLPCTGLTFKPRSQTVHLRIVSGLDAATQRERVLQPEFASDAIPRFGVIRGVVTLSSERQIRGVAAPFPEDFHRETEIERNRHLIVDLTCLDVFAQVLECHPEPKASESRVERRAEMKSTPVSLSTSMVSCVHLTWNPNESLSVNLVA